MERSKEKPVERAEGEPVERAEGEPVERSEEMRRGDTRKKDWKPGDPAGCLAKLCLMLADNKKSKIYLTGPAKTTVGK
jgi:hypothetical protein